MDMDDATYVTIAEAAKLLGVHPNTVRNRIKMGLLTATKVLTLNGEAYAIPRASVTPSQDPLQQAGRVPGGSNPLVSSGDAQSAALVTLTTGSLVTLPTPLQELVRPLVEENTRLHEMARAQAQELGRTQEQRDQACRELAELRAQLARVQAVPPSSPEAQARPIVPLPRPRSALGSLMIALARRLG